MNFLSEDSNYSTFILSTLSIFNVVFFFRYRLRLLISNSS